MNNGKNPFNELLKIIGEFKRDVNIILSQIDSSKSRIVTLYETRKKLAKLSLLQESLFEQSFDCIEAGLFRAAHVMAWAAFMDYLEVKISSDGFKKLFRIRAKWSKYKTLEELRENVVEYQIIEACRDLGLLGKTECNSVKGYLSTRNECAHPSGYEPDMNDAIGYVSNLLNRIAKLQKKKL